MKILQLFLILSVFIPLSASYISAEEPEITYPDEALQENPADQRDILTVEVTRSRLGLLLLGTILSGNESKVILKNPVTGRLGKYRAGEKINLVRGENVKVVEISNCLVLLERDGNYETMECSNKIPSVVFDGPGALSKYRIVRPGNGISLSESFMTDYDKDITLLSTKHKIDPYLVKAVIKAESNFNPKAVSRKNAQGIMQLIPATASDYGVDDPFDPKENIEGGVKYLKDLLDYFDGDVKLSLAAYNAGQGAVIKHGFTIPPYPETTDYIAKVLKYYKIFKAEKYALKSTNR